MPGTSYDEAARAIAGELPELPYLPEVPGRGVGADPVGRAIGLLVGLPAEVVPSGWRLSRRPGIDLRRAVDERQRATGRSRAALLRSGLDQGPGARAVVVGRVAGSAVGQPGADRPGSGARRHRLADRGAAGPAADVVVADRSRRRRADRRAAAARSGGRNPSDGKWFRHGAVGRGGARPGSAGRSGHCRGDAHRGAGRDRHVGRAAAVSRLRRCRSRFHRPGQLRSGVGSARRSARGRHRAAGRCGADRRRSGRRPAGSGGTPAGRLASVGLSARVRCPDRSCRHRSTDSPT